MYMNTIVYMSLSLHALATPLISIYLTYTSESPYFLLEQLSLIIVSVIEMSPINTKSYSK